MSQSLYRKVRMMIDIYCVVGIPLGLWILTNYVVGIIALVMIITVTLLRKRFLDEKAENLVLGVAPSGGFSGEKAADSQVDGRPVRIMVFAAALVTVIPIVSLGIHLASGEDFPIWLIGCVAAIWFGVAMTAVGQWLGGDKP
jgi:hypothetical protein